jgi:hypothetical protein
MAWNEPGNKDPWGRNKNNSSLDGVIKDFKKIIDDLLGGRGGSTSTFLSKKCGIFICSNCSNLSFYLESTL